MGDTEPTRTCLQPLNHPSGWCLVTRQLLARGCNHGLSLALPERFVSFRQILLSSRSRRSFSFSARESHAFVPWKSGAAIPVTGDVGRCFWEQAFFRVTRNRRAISSHYLLVGKSLLQIKFLEETRYSCCREVSDWALPCVVCTAVVDSQSHDTTRCVIRHRKKSALSKQYCEIRK
jgi:hypothetical protein